MQSPITSRQGKFGDRAGDGLTDYEAKTISIASSRDSFVNVSTLVHEVHHATLWERGFTDKKRWGSHDWIYFSEGPISMVLHDNPELMQYIANGYYKEKLPLTTPIRRSEIAVALLHLAPHTRKANPYCKAE